MMRGTDRVLLLLSLTLLLFPMASATRLQNIEAITPQAGDHLRVEANVSVAGNLSFQNQQTDMDLNSNRLEGLAAADSGDDAMRRDNIISQFVDASGDTMSGNLDMGGNALQNADWSSANSLGTNGGVDRMDADWGSTDGVGYDIDGSNVEIRYHDNSGEFRFVPYNTTSSTWWWGSRFDYRVSADRWRFRTRLVMEDTIDMGGNSITNFFGSACGAGSAVQDISDAGGFSCVSVGEDAGVDYGSLVNRSGGSANSMTGNLDMGSNSVTNVGGLGSMSIANGNDVSGISELNGGSNLHLQHQGTNGRVEVGADTGTITLDLNSQNITNIGAGNIHVADPQGNLDMNSNNLHMSNGVVRFDGSADRRLYGGSTSGGNNFVAVDGNWNELMVMGRVIGWTGSNLHIGSNWDGVDHTDDYIEIGQGVGAVQIEDSSGVNKPLEVTGGDVKMNGGLQVPVGTDAW